MPDVRPGKPVIELFALVLLTRSIQTFTILGSHPSPSFLVFYFRILVYEKGPAPVRLVFVFLVRLNGLFRGGFP
jgi:hypothetical protein